MVLEKHVGTKALEMFPTFIVGIELKDKVGEQHETEPQMCCQAPGRRGHFFFGGLIKLLPQD